MPNKLDPRVEAAIEAFVAYGNARVGSEEEWPADFADANGWRGAMEAAFVAGDALYPPAKKHVTLSELLAFEVGVEHGAEQLNRSYGLREGTWFYPENETEIENCCFSPSEVIERLYAYGHCDIPSVVAIDRALLLPPVYAAVTSGEGDEPFAYTLHATPGEAETALGTHAPVNTQPAPVPLWRPISEAPHDGSWFVAFDENNAPTLLYFDEDEFDAGLSEFVDDSGTTHSLTEFVEFVPLPQKEGE